MFKKITPLIIISIICIVIAVWALFFSTPSTGERSGVNIPLIMPVMLGIGALISFGADRLIKKYTSELKKVWVFEAIIVVPIIFYAIFLT